MGDNTRYRNAPLYTESIEWGGIPNILISLHPNVWMRKNKWVWLETHPDALDTYDPKKDVFIFLDGDTTNYNPHNIEKITRGELILLNSSGGVPIGSDPERTLIRIASNRLKSASLDAGERLGLVAKWGNVRTFKEQKRERERTRYASMTPEEKKAHNKHVVALRNAKMTPEKRVEYNRKAREYRAAHPEQTRANWKRYREKNRKTIRERQRAAYATKKIKGGK